MGRLTIAEPRRLTRPRSAAPAGLGSEPGVRYLFTVEAVRRLVARRDQVVGRAPAGRPARASPRCGRRCFNGFTFGRNVALGALGRGQPPMPGAEHPGSAAARRL